jgi:hypothetical protein
VVMVRESVGVVAKKKNEKALWYSEKLYKGDGEGDEGVNAVMTTARVVQR